MLRALLIAGLMMLSETVCAQEGQSSDTLRVLDELVVKAYRSNRPIGDVPVTVNVLDSRELSRFSPASLVSTVNTVAGVRMEERSPASYRFSIRGSLLRSPFGVRNVKFYWKGLPFTDGGGNTYLNLLDFATVGKMEIIKGPGASLYGAGTGGVVLLDAPEGSKPVSKVYGAGGSYGLYRFGYDYQASFDRSVISISMSQQHSDGYRKQTFLDRTNVRFNWDYSINNRSSINLIFLNANLKYGTPGGLNQAQYDADPRQARPASATAPGAEQQQASISNATYYYGAVYQNDWNERWTTTLGVFGSNTLFKNPAILNYERRKEENWGGRTETQYIFGADKKGKLTFGGEFQYLYSPVSVYDNNQGDPGNVRTLDRLRSRSFFAFAQVELELPYQFLATVGGSVNFLKYKFDRYSLTPAVKQEKSFDPGAYPRLALIKKFGRQASLYSSFSQGFSAPTLAEVRPSTGNINTSLNPEVGRSIEVGIRTEWFNRQLSFNLVGYDFRLNQTIVVQADAVGADYYINAGKTSQKGIESTAAWTPTWGRTKLQQFRWWATISYNDYHFLDYSTSSGDFTGNRLTGVPPKVFVTGLDITTKKGWYSNLTFNFTDRLPVNDANTAYAASYRLLSARVGKKMTFWKIKDLDLYLGGDNLLDEKYSLGNDLNALGGRYFNAAAPRNFYFGITVPF